MKELAFKLRFAWKNIIRNLGNSLSVFLSLVLTVMLTLIVFNMRLGFEKTFYYRDKETYAEIDIVITYDENATARLVNRRPLINEYLEDIRTPLVFFNLFVLVETEDTFYTELMSSSKADMERLIDVDIQSIGTEEVIITKSLAKEHNLSQNSQLIIKMLGTEYSYTVVQIIDDNGLFAGDKIFVDKNTLIADFYGVSGLDNLGNTIYVDVIDIANIDNVFERIINDDNYDNYLIEKTINEELNASKALYNSTIMIGIVSLILVTLMMVIHSLFPLLERKLSKQYALIRILGGDNRFVFWIWIFEIAILTVAASIVGSILAIIVMNFSSHSYGVQTIIGLGVWQTMAALALIAFYMFVEVLIRFQKIKKQGVVSLSSDYRYPKAKPKLWLFSLLALTCVLTYILKPFSYQVNALIVIMTCIFASFMGISLLLRGLSKLVGGNKKSLFVRFNLKYLKDNRYIHHSLEILYACLIVIVTALSIRSYIKQEVSSFKDQLNFDYAIANIFDYDENLLLEIESTTAVEHAAPMHFSGAAYFDLNEEENKLFNFCMMMPYADFLDSYAFEIEIGPTQEMLDLQEPFALLPSDYRFTHLLEVGDTIYLHVDDDYGIISLQVGGFFNVSYPNIIYTNLPEVDTYASMFPVNTVIVDSDVDILDELATAYGEEMYHVVPIDNLIGYYGSMYQTASDLALVLVGVMIASFMVVILNNTMLVYQTVKSDYAKLKTLGAENHSLFKSLVVEFMLSLIIIILFFVPSIMLFANNLPKLMLFFNYHRVIIPDIKTIILGIILVMAAFSVSYGIYALRIKNLDLIAEIKYE